MKCKKCGGNVIDIIEKQISIVTPIGHNERPLGSVFIARCPKCRSESSRYSDSFDRNVSSDDADLSVGD